MSVMLPIGKSKLQHKIRVARKRCITIFTETVVHLRAWQRSDRQQLIFLIDGVGNCSKYTEKNQVYRRKDRTANRCTFPVQDNPQRFQKNKNAKQSPQKPMKKRRCKRTWRKT